MVLTMAWKSLRAHPVRTVVLGAGFGLGVSVMATLLGVGEVVLDQARAPALVGGGDLIVTGVTGALTSARFVLSRVKGDAAVVAASPRRRAELFVMSKSGEAIPVVAHGGIPSLERALGAAETAGISSWTDTPRDVAWASPDPSAVLRAMDRFRAVPDVPARASSWAEWLYFKGRSGDVQFYMTFLVGPRLDAGRRVAGVRLQLDRGDGVVSYSASETVDEAEILRAAPDLTIGGASVRLDGLRYRIAFDLPRTAATTDERAVGTLDIEAVAGRSLTPIEMRGAGGWVSGYTVPVMSGRLSGSIVASGHNLELSGTGYHDHNWGFWKGVRWQWGQVAHEDLSFVYGRIVPPADVADPERVPGFLGVLGARGPVGFSTAVSVDETGDEHGQPQRVAVRAHGQAIDLTLVFSVDRLVRTAMPMTAAAPGMPVSFLQMGGAYRVTGTVGGRALDFTARGAAETFR